ncbi:MAG: DUF4402 domain-containing protein [Pseudomonadota bacterium]|nr:DUF4402 domain-containing protein [Pseudomonadota bacterium]
MTKFLTKAAIAATVATGLFATPAMAQVAENSKDFEATAVIVRPLVLTKVDDLNFGTITMLPALTNQTVSVSQAEVGACGGTNLTCDFPADPAASFTIAGVGTQTLTVDLGEAVPTALVNAADATKSVPFTVDAPLTTGLVDGVGAFAIGGSIVVSSTTVDGTYGADLNVTVSYN